MLSLKTKTQLEKDLNFRLFPRKSIKLKAEGGFSLLLKIGIEKYLNIHSHSIRTIMSQISNSNGGGNHINLDDIDIGVDNNVSIRKVTGVLSSTYYQSEEFLSLWMRSNYMGQSTEFMGNMFRYNEQFKQFILAKEVYNQIKRKYFNKNTDWAVIGEKLILGKTFNSVREVMIFYLPTFDYEGSSWMMTDKEYQFLLDCLYGELLIMEGMALLELKISGAETNANEMLTEGKELLEKTMEAWKGRLPILTGRRI